MIRITDQAIMSQEILDSLNAHASGSVVMHLGIVRRASEGKQVNSIIYKINAEQAAQEMTKIIADINAKWEVQDVALVRRSGLVKLGQTILIAAVSAPHQKEAFAACQWAIESLRKMASVNKTELYD